MRGVLEFSFDSSNCDPFVRVGINDGASEVERKVAVGTGIGLAFVDDVDNKADLASFPLPLSGKYKRLVLPPAGWVDDGSNTPWPDGD